MAKTFMGSLLVSLFSNQKSILRHIFCDQSEKGLVNEGDGDDDVIQLHLVQFFLIFLRVGVKKKNDLCKVNM